jgi:GNAT superfamily N-acetyltransferase
MENLNLIIKDAETKEEIDLFWIERNKYMNEDVIPNDSLGNPITDEEKKWFFSKEYKDHIMKLYSRKTDKLFIVFFEKNNIKVGFSVYVTYHSEDGKCFIVDFCIYKEFRNQGLGKKFFNLIKERESKKGTTYYALNLSNENNERFWKSLGFLKDKKDEYGNDVYILK